MMRLLLTTCTLLGFAPALPGQEEGFRKLLPQVYSSTASRVEGKKVTPDSRVAWSVTTHELRGGRQEGGRLIVLDNGVLAITLVPTRGLGLLDVTWKHAEKGRMRLGWDSPVPEVVHPSMVNLEARGGLGWLTGFNEFMCRCGLENVGQAGTDSIVTNTGAKADVNLTLHGKIANLPSSDVELLVDKAPPHRIRLRARVVERMLFGPQLVLESELSTEPGTWGFRIVDTVVNAGASRQEFQLLYHTNVGRPLLSEGAKVIAPVSRVTPVNEGSAKDAKTWGDVAGPKAGFVEQVYFLHPLADKDGRSLVVVHDKDAGQGMSLRWSVKELPYLTLWKNTGADEDGYVIGVEPGTSFPNARRKEREAGRVPTLAPGAKHRVTLDFQVHSSAKEVRSAVSQAHALQTEPPTIDEIR